MIGQNILLELQVGDRVQVYAYTSTGITDHKNSRYTQFIGILMRPSVDSLQEIVKRLGTTDMDDDVSLADDRSHSVMRGMNGGGGDSRRDSRRTGSTSGAAGARKVTSPPPQTRPALPDVFSNGLTNGNGVKPADPPADADVVTTPGRNTANTQNNQKNSAAKKTGKSKGGKNSNNSNSNNNKEISSGTDKKLQQQIASTEVPTDEEQENRKKGDKNILDLEPEIPGGEKEKNSQQQQSYLALTNLGMGKTTANNLEATELDGELGMTQQNGKNELATAAAAAAGNNKAAKGGKEIVAGNSKRKSMAEMASSTLKGFTKM